MPLGPKKAPPEGYMFYIGLYRANRKKMLSELNFVINISQKLLELGASNLVS